MKAAILLFVVVASACACFNSVRLFEIEATVEHELTYEKDTLFVYAYHRMNNGQFYLKLTNGFGWYVDKVKPIRDTIVDNWCY